MDECTTTYPCAQRCINTHGSFHCLCVDGFVPRPDDPTSCKSTSGEPLPSPWSITLCLLSKRLWKCFCLRVKSQPPYIYIPVTITRIYVLRIIPKPVNARQNVWSCSVISVSKSACSIRVLLKFQRRNLSSSLRTGITCENSTWMALTTHWLNRWGGCQSKRPTRLFVEYCTFLMLLNCYYFMC